MLLFKNKLLIYTLDQVRLTPTIHTKLCFSLTFKLKFQALKQQLDNCSHRVKTLLEMSSLIFHELGDSETKPAFPDDGVEEVQSKLSGILDLCQSLLLECTEKLDMLSKLLMGENVSHKILLVNRMNIVMFQMSF